MIIAVDTGNSEMKTLNFRFCSGLVEHRVKPLSSEYIEYAESFWTLSNDRVPYVRNKAADNRFFVLTLFAVAKELTKAKKLRAINEIDLAVGLPPEHMGDLRESFKKYFQKKNQVNFAYNGAPLTIMIRNVFVYVQGFAAMAPRMAELMKVKRIYVVDIGGMTTDVLLLSEGRPDKYFSLEIGIITLQNTLIGRVTARHDMTIEADHIEMVLQGQETILPSEVRESIVRGAQQHADVILEKLREMKVDLRTTPAIFIGGGSILLREYLETSPMVTKLEFVLESNANAVGYQMLAEAQLRRMELEGT
ncbi:MAG: ParM/StbA family protein [Oscillospiraceae bacterium]|nr:ParM/StbA family protein [Oscillospiraceae bacterium]